MKVLCINGVKIGAQAITGKVADMFDVIYEGEYYNVCGVVNSNSKSYYQLEERHPLVAYSAARFIQCSNLDETEMIRDVVEVQTV